MLNKNILNDAQCAVQASHAVSEYIYYNYENENMRKWIENHVTKVLLAGDVDDIEYLSWYHDKNKLTYRKFHEPDLNNQITAIAFEPTENYDLFKKYNLI